MTIFFTNEEKKAVKETEIKNEDNPYYETAGGNDTKDHLFLLSLSDIINTGYGFSDDMDYYDQARMAKASAYAKENGTENYADGTAWWWLRSPGNSTNYASDVIFDGTVNYDGNYVDYSSSGVRPALHLNLSSSVWKKSSEVTSDDKKTAITDSLPSGDDGQETTKPSGEPTGTPGGTAVTPAPTKTPDGTSVSAPTPTPIPTATQTPAAAGNTTGTTASGQTSNSSSSTADSVAESTDTDSVKVPAKIKSLKVTNKKAGKTVVSFKAASGAEGYQIQYSKNKKFTKAKKSKTTKKTTYYFRVIFM